MAIHKKNKKKKKGKKNKIKAFADTSFAMPQSAHTGHVVTKREKSKLTGFMSGKGPSSVEAKDLENTDFQYLPAIRAAQSLIEKGKLSAKAIAQRTQLPLQEVQSLVDARQGAQDRQGHRRTLEGNLKRAQAQLQLAQAAYRDKTTFSFAQAVCTFSREIRDTVSALAALASPERIALDILSNAVQPFFKFILKNRTTELAKTKARIMAVCPDPSTQSEVQNALDDMFRADGVALDEAYVSMVQRIAILLQCDLVALKKLSENAKEAARKGQ